MDMGATLVIHFKCFGPSLQSLMQMIKIYEEYAKEFDIQFNRSRAKLMRFNNKYWKEFAHAIDNHVIIREIIFVTKETILLVTLINIPRTL